MFYLSRIRDYHRSLIQSPSVLFTSCIYVFKLCVFIEFYIASLSMQCVNLDINVGTNYSHKIKHFVFPNFVLVLLAAKVFLVLSD